MQTFCDRSFIDSFACGMSGQPEHPDLSPLVAPVIITGLMPDAPRTLSGFSSEENAIEEAVGQNGT